MTLRLTYPKSMNRPPEDFTNHENAMRKFSELAFSLGGFDLIKADGASLVEVTPGQAVANAPSPAAPAAPAAPATPAPSKVGAGQVSAVAAARVERHERYLAANGIILPPPLFAPGTRVVDIGDDNFRLSREEWTKLPFAKDAALAVAKTVDAENREDVNVPLNSIRMLPDGKLTIPDHGFDSNGQPKRRPLYLEREGFGQLIEQANYVLPRAKSLMTILQPSLRADVFNAQIVKASNDPIKLRLRDNHGGKETRQSVYSVVSKTYAPFNIDEVARSLASSFGDEGYRAEVVYKPDVTGLKFTAFYHADQVVDLAAGDVFKVGVEVKASDNGSGGINMRAVVIRNCCLNLIILGTGEVNLMSKRHRGEQAFTEIRIWDAIQRANAIFAPFAEEWKIARRVSMADVIGFSDSIDIAKALAEEAKVGGVVSIKPDIFSEMLVASLNRENENDSVADWMNALTRLHEMESLSNDNVEAVEAAVYPYMQVLNKKALAMSLV